MMLFKGNSSRLELLIEKIQNNKEHHDTPPGNAKGLWQLITNFVSQNKIYTIVIHFTIRQIIKTL